MARQIDLTLLRAFMAVTESGGMTSAARQLNLTQAAVSQQIKRLEEQFSNALFDRSSRQLEMTPAGERLYAHAQRILSLNDEIWGVMTSPEVEGEIKVGVPHDLVAPFMPPILKSFARDRPRVDVTLVTDNSPTLREELRSGEVDLTLTTEPYTHDGGELLFTDRLVWAGAKNGDAHMRNPLPVTLGSDSCAFRPTAVRALSDSGRDWRLVCKVSDMNVICAAVQADLGIAPMLSQTVPENLVVLNDESGLPALNAFHINLYTGTLGAKGIVGELADHVRQHFALRYPKAA